MKRAEAEKLVGSRVRVWAAANGEYVGVLVKLRPGRGQRRVGPWRALVKVVGVLRCAGAWDVARARRGLPARRGFRAGDVIEVKGSNVAPWGRAHDGRDYLDLLRSERAALADLVRHAGPGRGEGLRRVLAACEALITEEAVIAGGGTAVS
jgi:hypothetical protein